MQIARSGAFPISVPQLTGNAEMPGSEGDRLVDLAKAAERNAQVAHRHTFHSPVFKLTGNVEILGVEIRSPCRFGQACQEQQHQGDVTEHTYRQKAR